MDKSSTILVAGATGTLGGEICRQLAAKNKKVKGLVRITSDAGKLARLREAGIETVTGDLKDRASLLNALKGVSAVISTVSCTFSRQEGDSIQTVDDEGQQHLVSAAAEAGVKQFIFVSFIAMKDECALQTAKRKTEKLLVASGMQYTILQPTFFMDSWLSPALGFDYPNAKATIYGDGNNKISWIAVKDVAACAVAAVDNPAAENKVIELGGPAALSPLETVAIFETVLGNKFAVQLVPEAVLSAQKAAAPDPLSESFAVLMLSAAGGSIIDNKQMMAVFPMSLTTVNDYANT